MSLTPHDDVRDIGIARGRRQTSNDDGGYKLR
jgi:hypothetical protein